MVNFPAFVDDDRSPARKLDAQEYLAFCDFLIKNNPHLTPETCMERKSGEEEISEPFKL